MNIKIKPLEEKYLNKAVDIAVDSDVGERKYIRPWMKSKSKYFVALDGDKVVGEIGWYKDDGRISGEAMGMKFPREKNIYWISYFSVDSSYRNMGIGLQLLEHLEQVVRELGGKQMWVYTDKANRFYEKNGYEFVQKIWLEDAWEYVLKKIL